MKYCVQIAIVSLILYINFVGCHNKYKLRHNDSKCILRKKPRRDTRMTTFGLPRKSPLKLPTFSQPCNESTYKPDNPCGAFGYEKVRGYDICIYISPPDANLTYYEAKSRCASAEGHLVVICYEEFDKRMRRMLLRGAKAKFWIGLRQRGSHYYWLEKYKMLYSYPYSVNEATKYILHYEDFDKGYQLGHREFTCFVLDTAESSDRWHAVRCGSRRPYICQRKKERSLPVDTTLYKPNWISFEPPARVGCFLKASCQAYVTSKQAALGFIFHDDSGLNRIDPGDGRITMNESYAMESYRCVRIVRSELQVIATEWMDGSAFNCCVVEANDSSNCAAHPKQLRVPPPRIGKPNLQLSISPTGMDLGDTMQAVCSAALGYLGEITLLLLSDSSETTYIPTNDSRVVYKEVTENTTDNCVWRHGHATLTLKVTGSLHNKQLACVSYSERKKMCFRGDRYCTVAEDIMTVNFWFKWFNPYDLFRGLNLITLVALLMAVFLGLLTSLLCAKLLDVRDPFGWGETVVVGHGEGQSKASTLITAVEKEPSDKDDHYEAMSQKSGSSKKSKTASAVSGLLQSVPGSLATSEQSKVGSEV